jgi:hypothetical protein
MYYHHHHHHDLLLYSGKNRKLEPNRSVERRRRDKGDKIMMKMRMSYELGVELLVLEEDLRDLQTKTKKCQKNDLKFKVLKNLKI